MTMEPNKATAQRFVDEVVNGGNLAVIDELLAPDFVDHGGQPGVGRAAADQMDAVLGPRSADIASG